MANIVKSALLGLRQVLATQRSNFSSKAIGKIIAKAEAKKTFASAVPRQYFAEVIEQISVFALAIPSAVFGSYFGNVVLFN